MDRYNLRNAIREAKKVGDCHCLSSDLQETISELIVACEEYLILDEKTESIDFDDLTRVLTDLRDEVEDAQCTLSVLDDKFGDIYSKLDDAESEVIELENNND